MAITIPKEEFFASGHNACAGCGLAIAIRMATKAAGKNTIVVNSTGCSEVVSSPYPHTAWRLPWMHGAFENAAPIASGIAKVLKRRKSDTRVLVFGGDGATFDIGFGALSGAIERGHKFVYVCLDNEAYMNTGIQRSGSTPKYSATTTTPAGKAIHGKQEYKKNMPFIIAAHGCYVATANVAYPNDIIKKVQKGFEQDGPAYIQVFCPCIPGWKMESKDTIKLSKLAFETNIYPMYEIENGVVSVTQKPQTQKPVQEYLKLQGRFKHLNEEEIKKVQERINSEVERINKLAESKTKLF